MWIVTEDGDAVDLNKADFIEILTLGATSEVRAIVKSEAFTLKTFDNVDDAKAYVAKFVDTLNGNLPTDTKGYSFIICSDRFR